MAWCRDSNLLLNTTTTKETVVDFRKRKVTLNHFTSVGMVMDTSQRKRHRGHIVGVNTAETLFPGVAVSGRQT